MSGIDGPKGVIARLLSNTNYHRKSMSASQGTIEFVKVLNTKYSGMFLTYDGLWVP